MSADAPWASGGIVLAAGAGRRMGHLPKSLLLRDGEPLVLRQLRLLREAGVGPCVVVLGHHADAIAPVCRGQATLVRNSRPDEGGTALSLRLGLRGLPDGLPGIVVTLGDLPLLGTADIAALLDAWRARPAGIHLLLPVHDEAPGHPLILDAALRRELLAAPEPRTLKAWRAAHPQGWQALAVDHARGHRDVDTPADLQALRRDTGVALSLPVLPPLSTDGAHPCRALPPT